MKKHECFTTVYKEAFKLEVNTMYTHFQMESNLPKSEIGMPLERQKNF